MSEAIWLSPLRLYPERDDGHLDPRLSPAARIEGLWASRFAKLRAVKLRRKILPKVQKAQRRMARMSASEIAQEQLEIRTLLRRANGYPADLSARALVVAAHEATAVLGMTPHPVQFVGAYALLSGMLAEMETGEGKSLTAALAAAVAGMAGEQVHLITSNDYLATRDADSFRKFFGRFDLTTAGATNGQSPADRMAVYSADIAYLSNKEAAFDYLRDRLDRRTGEGEIGATLRNYLDGDNGLRMRGLPFAIVDEADSVMIDEARTPLILSAERETELDEAVCRLAFSYADKLQEGTDFQVEKDLMRITLTEDGGEKLDALANDAPPSWDMRIFREERVRQALAARYLFERDRHYLVNEDKVQIIDEYTGRILADRFYAEGLHQMIEAKEKLPPSSRRVTLARITYQVFFRRYVRLAGMTGTAQEVADEFWSVYGLPVARIPTHRPVRRQHRSPKTYPTSAERWEAVADRVEEFQVTGQPVLIGTRSVGASLEGSDVLTARGIQHVVLNAAQDAEEADIIARCGQLGRVTIATNMAGRGADIRIGTGVAELGGLAVVMTEYHDAGRIDRQLAGRCARQGEPGQFEVFVSDEDALLAEHGSQADQILTRYVKKEDAGLHLLAQRRAERKHRRMRTALLKADRKLSEALPYGD